LIELQTSSGTDVYPAFQFETDEDTHHLNPRIARAWPIVKNMQIEQLGESSWSAASRLTADREEFGNASWADVLMDPEVTDDQADEVYTAIVVDAFRGARLGGDLHDPTDQLPETSAGVFSRVVNRALEQI
jgi:hypothetical protein